LEDRLPDALIVARALHLAATVMLVGAVIFHYYIGAPALHQASEGAGARVTARFTQWTAWTGLAVAVASGAVWVVVLTAQITGDPIWDTLPDDAMTLLTQTQFGRVAELRFVIALLLAGALAWHRRSDGLRWLTVALALCFAGSLAWTGHSGAGDGFAGYIQVAADAFHLIAAAAWVGGLIPLACLFVLASRPANGLSPAQVADVTRRFSTMGIISVAILLITGLINTWYLVASVAILVGSSYGQLLMIKVALFLIMVGIATINRTRLTPMITTDGNGYSTATGRLAWNSLTEASLGLAMLAIVGALGTLPPELADEHHMHMHAH
jgi:copper resistance protein D